MQNNGMDQLENIKALYAQIPVEFRREIIALVSEEFKVTKSSVTTGWFSRWGIPEKYNVRENLIVLLQNFIANKNNVAV